MAYKHKPDKGILFPNEKTKDTQPDYTGSYTDQDNISRRISAWINEKDGKQYLSLSFQDEYKSSTA